MNKKPPNASERSKVIKKAETSEERPIGDAFYFHLKTGSLEASNAVKAIPGLKYIGSGQGFCRYVVNTSETQYLYPQHLRIIALKYSFFFCLKKHDSFQTNTKPAPEVS
jgi:hypothetical protein